MASQAPWSWSQAPAARPPPDLGAKVGGWLCFRATPTGSKRRSAKSRLWAARRCRSTPLTKAGHLRCSDRYVGGRRRDQFRRRSAGVSAPSLKDLQSRAGAGVCRRDDHPATQRPIFMTATGLECSCPTVQGGPRRDELESTGHYCVNGPMLGWHAIA